MKSPLNLRNTIAALIVAGLALLPLIAICTAAAVRSVAGRGMLATLALAVSVTTLFTIVTTVAAIVDRPDGDFVAYLSEGAAVTIEFCDENNWCRISKPRAGWVSGDYLRR